MADKNTFTSSATLWDVVNTNTRQAAPGKDRGLISKEGGSFVLKENGAAVQASGMYAQHIVDKDTGTITDYSFKSNTNTVQKSIVANDISLNNHKLNSQLYELTNMKNVMGTAIGNLTVAGTVLVKTYEPNLKKYVFIRRQIRVPIFSNLLDSYKIDDRLDLKDSNEIYKYKIKKEDGDK